MNEVYILAEDLNKWIINHLPQNRDLYTISDLIAAIEDMDSEIEDLERKIEEMENKDEESNNNWED